MSIALGLTVWSGLALAQVPADLPPPKVTYPAVATLGAGQPPAPSVDEPTSVAPILESDSPFTMPTRHRPLRSNGTERNWPEIWGYTGSRFIAYGEKMAPNGVPYDPYFSMDLDLNIGLLPEREFYLYSSNTFWAQRPGVGITNPAQGRLDFSKRQIDLNVGAAWNFASMHELRVFGYSSNNLNRGLTLSRPEGYKDGIGIEDRWYLKWTDIYDVGRMSFLSLGYMPTKRVQGEDGMDFKPSFFGRAFLVYEFTPRWYAYGDNQFIMERPVTNRLWFLDYGTAIRPFDRYTGLEFRVGCETNWDVKVHRARPLIYTTCRIVF